MALNAGIVSITLEYAQDLKGGCPLSHQEPSEQVSVKNSFVSMNILIVSCGCLWICRMVIQVAMQMVHGAQNSRFPRSFACTLADLHARLCIF